jgi:hypothetical protein
MSPVKRSWADIVKGQSTASDDNDSPIAKEVEQSDLCAEEISTEASEQILKPSQRGTWQCHCFGEVLVMLGHYGWIMPFGEVEHPDVGKTGGRIYVHKRDVQSGVKLLQGDVVSFYLYADQQGLGAEHCQLEQRTTSYVRGKSDKFIAHAESQLDQTQARPGWNVLASEFKLSTHAGWNVFAGEFTPGDVSNCLDKDAAEFIPSGSGNHLNTNAAEFYPSEYITKDTMPSLTSSTPCVETTVFSINPAFLSDDEESDTECIANKVVDVSGNDGDKESSADESDQSSECCDDSDSDDGLVVLQAPLNFKCESSIGSTSVGDCSDSDSEGTAPPLGAPPGLMLPKGWRPPPGLSLEGL